VAMGRVSCMTHAQGLALDEFHELMVSCRLFSLGRSTRTMLGWFQAQPQLFHPAGKRCVKHNVTLELRVGDLQHHGSPVALSVALKMDAIPLRASTSVNWY